MNDMYFPIRLNTLRPDVIVYFDVYLRLGNRYIHYNRSQDEMEGQRLKNLKSKGVRKLFILAKEEDSYLKYLEEGLNTLQDKSQDINTRGALAHDVMVAAVENAEKNLETEEGFKGQKKHFDQISQFVTSDRHAIKSMLSNAGISVDNNHHSATVSSLALAVAAKFGMENKTDLFELGTAALLHDIGKNKFNFDPMKPRDQMTKDEMKQFRNHPKTAIDLLSGKPYISSRILGLIAAHEEMGEGEGFPDKINLFKQPVSYQILNMVNQFDHFSTENKLQFQPAMDGFFEKYGKQFHPELINILATVLS